MTLYPVYSSDPSFIFSTATSANPKEHAMVIYQLRTYESIYPVLISCNFQTESIEISCVPNLYMKVAITIPSISYF